MSLVDPCFPSFSSIRYSDINEKKAIEWSEKSLQSLICYFHGWKRKLIKNWSSLCILSLILIDTVRIYASVLSWMTFRFLHSKREAREGKQIICIRSACLIWWLGCNNVKYFINSRLYLLTLVMIMEHKKAKWQKRRVLTLPLATEFNARNILWKNRDSRSRLNVDEMAENIWIKVSSTYSYVLIP